MKFNSERSLYLNDDINTHSSAEVISGISKLQSADPETPITLFINSSGGNVSDSFAVYEYVTKLLKPNLQTVVLGEASSMAVMIFLMGEKRYIGKLAVMRFHRFSLTVEKGTPLTAKQAEGILRNLERSEEEYIDIIVEKSSGKINREEARNLLDSDMLVPALKAVELGLAHEILT